MKDEALQPYPKKAVCVHIEPRDRIAYLLNADATKVLQDNTKTISLASWENRHQLGYDNYSFDYYVLRNAGLRLYRFEGQYYRPAGLLRIAHERGNTDLTSNRLSNRLSNATDGIATEEMLLTPVKHPLNTRRYWYLGQKIGFDDIMQLAKDHHNPLTRTTITNRLRHHWSIYRIITTPSHAYGDSLTIQYNQIADLVEKYGREKGLQIWLGQKHN